MERRQVNDGDALGGLLADHVSTTRQRLDGGLHALLPCVVVQLEQRERAFAQRLFGDRDVTSFGGILQRLEHARLNARRAVFFDAQLLRDAIGGLESHAPDVEGQPVGLPRDDVDGVLAVALVDASGERGARAVRLEEDHDLADRALLLPPLEERLHALLAEARHEGQALRLLV